MWRRFRQISSVPAGIRGPGVGSRRVRDDAAVLRRPSSAQLCPRRHCRTPSPTFASPSDHLPAGTVCSVGRQMSQYVRLRPTGCNQNTKKRPRLCSSALCALAIFACNCPSFAEAGCLVTHPHCSLLPVRFVRVSSHLRYSAQHFLGCCCRCGAAGVYRRARSRC